MTGMQVSDQRLQWVGEEWIQALIDKDFKRLTSICQPEVHSRLMTPRRVDAYENANDLSLKVEGWFLECSAILKEQVQIRMVGEKLAIFYRLSFVKEGEPRTAEQQIYCSLRDGLIDQLSLLCSGFQLVQDRVAAAPISKAFNHPPAVQQPGAPSSLQADAFLKMDTGSLQGSTCALLTPAIKRKLGEMNSGQVLEVSVDDPSVQTDIEAWCRLSGNSLLKSDSGAGAEFHFYLLKK